MTSTAADWVGFDKMMWGSNPRTMTAVTYRTSLVFIEKTAGIPKECKALLLGEHEKHFMDLAIWQFRKNPKHGGI